MMRLARRALLLVALSLLTSAAPAYAECAWVLWGQGMTPSSSGDLQVLTLALESYTDRAACETEKLARRTNQRKDDKGAVVSFVCLPDTVDPRGPKGK